MMILLSSAKTPRYRNDILRCLAAPIGGMIQFRYERKVISPEVYDLATREPAYLHGDGLVSFIDSDRAQERPLIPVRRVWVRKVAVHGSTLSLQLEMAEYVAANPSEFTREISEFSKQQNPYVVDPETKREEGYYLFQAVQTPKSLALDTTIDMWEKSVGVLAQCAAFTNEPFFWTVVSVENPAETYSLKLSPETWPRQFIPSAIRDINIYHFHPVSRGGPLPQGSSLSISAGGGVEIMGKSTAIIDSRYDLIRFRIKPNNETSGNLVGWVDIETNSKCSLVLTVPIGTNRGKWSLYVIWIGLLLVATNLADLLKDYTVLKVLGTLVFGFLAAYMMVFKVKRID